MANKSGHRASIGFKEGPGDLHLFGLLSVHLETQRLRSAVCALARPLQGGGGGQTGLGLVSDDARRPCALQ
jgi:hypothetical protein